MDVLEQRRANATGQAYVSIFEGHEECKWSEWKYKSAEEMMKHVRDVVFPFIKNIHDGEKTLFSQHMKDAVFIIPKPSLVQEAVGIIDELDISGQTSDVQGDIYEYLLSQLATAGKNGQFRTPRHIIRMIVELVDPGVNDRICDPACGTAGFLFTAYRYILKKYTSPEMVTEDEEGDWHGLIGDCITEQEAWDKLHQDTFYGFDFDSTMVRIALMNMVLHGIRAPHIESTDTLSNQYSGEEEFTVILANPPFKGSIDKNDINEKLTLTTTKTELLFVEKMYRLLEIGGKCGVIVPDGVLFGSSNVHRNLRKLLLEKCQLEGIVSMPSGVFKPYSGVSTAVLIFTKGGQTEKVWFYNMEADGYSLDDKRTPLDKKGDIPDIIKQFRKRREENPADRKGKFFYVPAAEIKNNNYDLSISRYKEIEYEEIKYEKPEIIIEKIEELEGKILENIDELKWLLNEKT